MFDLKLDIGPHLATEFLDEEDRQWHFQKPLSSQNYEFAKEIKLRLHSF